MKRKIRDWIADWNEAGYEAVNIYREKPHWKSRIAWHLSRSERLYNWLAEGE
jgi:hypothetical protein